MLTAAAFCPQAPALPPTVGRGLDAELGPVREACRAAVRDIAAPGTRLAVLGAEVPAGASIVEWLLAEHDRIETVSDADPDATALLVLGDGSACRTEKAPGYLDERAAGFDAGVAAALGSGDPLRLAAVDTTLAGELLAAGIGPWHRAAKLLAAGTYTADLRYDDMPFGVGYFVAVWQRA